MATPTLEEQVLVALWQEHNGQRKLDPLVSHLASVTRSNELDVISTLRSLHTRGMLILLEDPDGGVKRPVNANMHGRPGWNAALLSADRVTKHWEDRG